MPKDDENVEALIEHTHRCNGHSGTEYIRNILRGEFCILSDAQTVRKVIGRCMVCKKNFKKPASQKMAGLPKFRLEEGTAFDCSGTDLFGPFQTSRGRASVKVWVVIFTCLKVRAVHFELVESISTSSFLMALSRFQSRRQNLRHLYCDCGTNFIGAEKELERAVTSWNEALTPEEQQMRSIEFSFIPPMAHHRGGAWEALIRVARRHFAVLLGKETVPLEVFSTVMVEVEAILNKRPLTPVSSDPRDMDALTPMDFLCPGWKSHSSVSILPVAPPGGEGLKYAWMRARNFIDGFWRRWSAEYLATLKDRQKWHSTQEDIKKGTLVLLVDEIKHRSDWRMGRVVDTFGDESHVRTVTVRVASGKVFRRDITKVVNLELGGAPE